MSETCLTSECSSYLNGPLGVSFTSTVQLLFTAQCLINDQWPPDSSYTVKDLSFDYIVVGAGSAGSVVAARLSEDEYKRVLLLEAGGDPPFESQVPSATFSMQNTEVDWQFQTENDSVSCQGVVGGQCFWPSGKMLGGSSSMNENKFTRGNAKDYDDLEAAGNTGWNYAEALKYFKKSENLSDSYIRNHPILSKYHNFNGPLGIVRNDDTNPLQIKLMNAYKELGYAEQYDINGPIQNGVFRIQSSIQNGRVSSTARAFLSPASERPNLIVFKNALATKILFNGTTAVGVAVTLDNGTNIEAYADKEVIVSAGAIRTPQLLMLSGVGTRKDLDIFNITVVADLPVGRNLIEHVVVPVLFTIKMELPVKSQRDSMVDVAEYIALQTGFHSRQSDLVAGVYLYTNLNNNEKMVAPPDIQLVHSSQSKNSSSSYDFCINVSKYTQQICESLQSYNTYSATLTIYPMLLLPKSRGYLTLASTDATQNPKIYSNIFSEKEDVKQLIKAINLITDKLGKTPSFKAIGAKPQRINITACNSYVFKSDGYWECLMGHIGLSSYHSSGTAKMGPESDVEAVVNPNLQVYGVSNLRVVDASVMPQPIRGNINAAVIMFAEKASDIIKNAHK